MRGSATTGWFSMTAVSVALALGAILLASSGLDAHRPAWMFSWYAGALGLLMTMRVMLSGFENDALPMLQHEANQRRITFYALLARVRQHSEFRTLLDEHEPNPPDITINAKEDLAFLCFTGGSTGLPKGVMLTHFNRMANLR